MAKLSKKQIQELTDIRNRLQKARKYLKDEKVIGISHRNDHPNGGSYQIINPACMEGQSNPCLAVDVVNKTVGSDLMYLYSALQSLDIFLQE